MVLIAVMLAPLGFLMADERGQAEQASFNDVADQLEAGYAEQLESLRTELLEALPPVDELKKSAFLRAREAEVAAEAAVNKAQQRAGELTTAKALVGHAKGKWIGGADKGIAAAKEKLKAARSDAEREAAQKDLIKWEKNREDGVAALNERQANLEKAERERPVVEKELKEAESSFARAKLASMEAAGKLGLDSLLSSDQFDARLAKFVVLLEATPKGLATFAAQGEDQRNLIEQMFGINDLLVEMVVADGAKEGRYGQAMEIYRGIWQASDKAAEGPLRRLALAISLEHAVPVAQRNAVADKDAPATVDPVKRYLHYEQALLNGELDPAFGQLDTWDYRMVVDGEEPDEILTWGREMLRNYRPDQITDPDYRWRYVAAVRSDIRYGSQDNHYDKDELQFFQNILMNGGVCGRRAFFGRFILRAFGIPTTARPQRGHAALAHWTPDGWVVCLGGGWGAGWTKTRYDRDLDFLANTQARAAGDAFMRVKRAQWIGDLMGEPRIFGFRSGKPGFWYGVSLCTQKQIIEESEAKTLAAVGEDIGEANETKEKVEVAEVTLSELDRRISESEAGVITIPATATSKPTQSSGKILFMESSLGGKQLHYGRTGGHQDFEYVLQNATAGKYQLTARVVTPSWKQSLHLTVNDSPGPIVINLPFTVGRWETTDSVEIELVEGENRLSFSREGEVKGITIRDFTLTPSRGPTSH